MYRFLREAKKDEISASPRDLCALRPPRSLARKKRKKTSDSRSTTPVAAPAEKIAEIYSSVKFVELFAGSAGLTHAVDSAGVPVVPPDDIDIGGTDFRDQSRLRHSNRCYEILLRRKGRTERNVLYASCSYT